MYILLLDIEVNAVKITFLHFSRTLDPFSFGEIKISFFQNLLINECSIKDYISSHYSFKKIRFMLIY